MSDSDSGPEFPDSENLGRRANFVSDKGCQVVTLSPTESIYEGWNNIPICIKKEAGQLMKICAFWYPILLQRQESNNSTRWAVQVGLIDPNDSSDLSLRQLYKIEILEALLRALEKGCFNMDPTRHMIWISNKFNLRSPEVLEDALHWLERTGEPHIPQRIQELGHGQTCYTVLHHVFTEYAQYIQAMGVNWEGTMKALAASPCEWAIKKSEEMKSKGNENFQNKKYATAVKCYSQAIRYHPENHIIYGNRALCYIRSEKYLKAVGDGKRATLIKPLWAKGHYRYCEALFYLGEFKRALEANTHAQNLCQGDREGMKDLDQQHKKFIFEMKENKAGLPQKSCNKRPDSVNSTNAGESQPQTLNPASKVDPTTTTKAPQSKVLEVKMDVQTQPGKNEGNAHAAGNTKDTKQTKSEMADKSNKGGPNTPTTKKPKNRNYQSQEETAPESTKIGVCEALRSAVEDGYIALTDLRSRNAEQAFSQALSVVEANTPKDLGISTLDVVLLLYGRASALIEIGQLEELAEAQRDFEKIKSFEERTFQCLVYYGIGRVYLKENRYKVALGKFSDSLQMVKNQITPGKLTWPMTKEIVKETQLDYFKELLVNAIELCRFPPIPDAICRHENCLGHLKIEIYFTDPDFKGFIQIGCCQSCIVEYHISCWKTLKASSFCDKNEKDFLQEPCFTPDCRGRICSIKIYGSTGLIKCKFEAVITKPGGPKKLRVNQKCTSPKKLKSKEDHKLRRKQHKQASQNKQSINDHILLEKENAVALSQEKVCSRTMLLYRDRVLLQISLSRELFREEKGHNTVALMKSLKPWLELDWSKGNKVAEKIIGIEQQQPDNSQQLGQVVDLLLERRNRVWARVLIHFLSSCLDINPKLHDWAHKLNSEGLNAARVFIERYTGHLEELDLAPLLNFVPMQDMLIEKFGTGLDLFSRSGLTVTEYLKQAPAQDIRLFIWSLEEHRDQYDCCHTILDEYFEIMDGHCLVIKKSENENQNNSPIKTRNRSRKKKQKEAKGVIVFSGRRGSTPRDEHDFFDENDSLSFLHPSDPFSVPNHLREQVADFEDLYNSTDQRSHFKNILDNNPDTTKESLYDYFAQILEEHGPLGAQDSLLVGELDNFPPVAQQKIQQAGGFEPFLLESLRFIKMGMCIGLAKHAVSLQEASHGNGGCGLDDLDVIADLDMNSPATDFEQGQKTASYLQEYSFAQPEPYPFLPSPYVFGSQHSQLASSTSRIAGTDGTWIGDDPRLPWTTENEAPTNLQYDSVFSAGDMGDLDLYASEVDVMESINSGSSTLTKPSTVQACQEAKRSVAVNTEIYELCESSNGDINKKERSNRELDKQIYQLMKDCDLVNLKFKKAITSLEEDFEEINTNVQVTNKELELFQQKLEDMVRKDQKEKKANQETLKALKTEIEELVDKQEGFTKCIREKTKKYDTQLNDFLELSNQSAAEKMSLEDEIKRCRDLCAKAAKRSEGAELSILENCRKQGLYDLSRSLSDARTILAKVKEVAHRYPPQVLAIIQNNWRACAQEAEEKIFATEAQYKEQMEQVTNGSRLSVLPSVSVPETPTAPIFLSAQQLPSGQLPHLSSPQVYCGPLPIGVPFISHQAYSQSQESALSAAIVCPGSGAQAGTNAEGLSGLGQQQPQPQAQTIQPSQGSRPLEVQQNTFDKVLERLSTIFPDYSRPDLMKFVCELRTANGGTLTSMAFQDVINGVTQIILDHQEESNSADNGKRNPLGRKIKQCGTPSRCDSPNSVSCTGLPHPAHAWGPVGPQRPSQTKALNMEDPCIICHDDMSPDDICVLECRHSFHKECIKSWLREQSTCPTCREHALLPEDFPMLSGRIRRGHTPAAFS